jgi:hypothetical protein
MYISGAVDTGSDPPSRPLGGAITLLPHRLGPHARNLLQILTNKICHDICSNVDPISGCSLAVISSN